MPKSKIVINKIVKDCKTPKFALIKIWLENIAKVEDKNILSISYNLVDEDTILKINKQFLKHDYYTDIITFDYSQNNDIQGEVYISVKTVETNAQKYQIDFKTELVRVFAHGLLHLIGYNDKSDLQKLEMRQKEDYYIEQFNNTVLE